MAMLSLKKGGIDKIVKIDEVLRRCPDICIPAVMLQSSYRGFKRTSKVGVGGSLLGNNRLLLRLADIKFLKDTLAC
jgi:hypothetical protein